MLPRTNMRRRGASFALTPAPRGHELRAWWQEDEEGYGWCDHRSFLSGLTDTEAEAARGQLTAEGWKDVS